MSFGFGRPRKHYAKATLPDGTQVQYETKGCKPYLVIKRFTMVATGQVGAWEVHKWCDSMTIAHQFAENVRDQFKPWSNTKKVEVLVLTTSCHIATGQDKEPR